MGTDIHIQIEIKREGKWEWVNKNLPDYINKHSYIPISRDRNYHLFAILANVRNGSGFAGCDTGDGFNFISEPKGLPLDMDAKLLIEQEENGILGDHSFSYVTLKELIDFDWKQTTKLRGFVNKDEFIQWVIDKKEPSQYCGGTSGKCVTNKEMQKLIDLNKYNGEYTQVEWTQTYIDAVGFDTYWEFTSLSHFIDYDKIVSNEDIRIVFGFDS